MRFRIPDDMTGIVIEHQQFENEYFTITSKGKTEKVNTIKVPDRFDVKMASLGYVRIGMTEAVPTTADASSASSGQGSDAVALAVKAIADIAKRASKR